MKIVVVSNMYPSNNKPSYGVFVHSFVEGLEFVGIEYDLIVLKYWRSFIAKFYFYLVFYLRICFRIITDRKCIYYVHYGAHSLIPFYLLSFLVDRKKVIVNFHGGDILPRSSFGIKLLSLLTPFIKTLRNVVVPSNYLKEVCLKKFNHHPKNIFISPSSGVDLNVFQRKSQNTKSDLLQIGYVGRMDKGKGFDVLMAATGILYKRGFSFCLHAIGDGEYMESYKQSCNKSIVFHGAKSKTDLPMYFNMFDVFVFPSFSESLGLVGVESMACGVPVIGSNIDGIKTYLNNGYNGFVFKTGDSENLVRKIILYAELSKEEKVRLSENALKTSLKYDSKIIYQEMGNYLRLIYEKSS